MTSYSLSLFSFSPSMGIYSTEAAAAASTQRKRPSFKKEAIQNSFDRARGCSCDRYTETRKEQRAEWIRSKWRPAKREFYENYDNIRNQALSHKDSAVNMFPMWDEETAEFFTGYCAKVDAIMAAHIKLLGKASIKNIKTSFTTHLTELMRGECLPAVLRQTFSQAALM